MPNYEIYAQHPFNDEGEAEAVARMLRKQAVSKKTGALVDVVPDPRTKEEVWLVRVWYPVNKDSSKDKKRKR